MNGASLLVAALKNEGVERIFGVPGEENLDLLESLHRSSIDLIVMRHEQTAAFGLQPLQHLPGEHGNVAAHIPNPDSVRASSSVNGSRCILDRKRSWFHTSR